MFRKDTKKKKQTSLPNPAKPSKPWNRNQVKANRAATAGKTLKNEVPDPIPEGVPEEVHGLLEMLTYKRPAWSTTEQMFIQRYIDVLPGMLKDKFGNRVLKLGENPTVLFSCHTDTVHRTHGTQKILVDPVKHEVFVQDECLGADDGTGVWLMVNMIKAGVEGLYIFHRAEEIGGQGSAYIKKNTPELLKDIKHAIAFDRKLFDHVITYQGTKCASDEFATEFGKRLGLKPEYGPNDGGSFTDTANYTSIIPECTNLSVGYNRQHTKDETQDYEHAKNLLEALVNMDWKDLPVVRETTDNSYKSYGGSYDDFGWGGHYGYGGRGGYQGGYNRSMPNRTLLSRNELEKLVKDNPDVAVQMLYRLRADAYDRDCAEETVTWRGYQGNMI